MITKQQDELIDRHVTALHKISQEANSNLLILMVADCADGSGMKIVHSVHCTKSSREELSGRPDAIACIQQTCRTARVGMEMVEMMGKLNSVAGEDSPNA